MSVGHRRASVAGHDVGAHFHGDNSTLVYDWARSNDGLSHKRPQKLTLTKNRLSREALTKFVGNVLAALNVFRNVRN